MTKIYTKTGDKGKTSLVGGSIINKHDLQVESYGTIDELNSSIGLTFAELDEKSYATKYKTILSEIQKQLFTIGAWVATETNQWNRAEIKMELSHFVNYLEKNIDEIEIQLSPLTNFILPRGSRLIATTHQNRTICRRVERKISALIDRDNDYIFILQYFNRLADFFFILVRFIHKIDEIPETYWKSDN